MISFIHLSDIHFKNHSGDKYDLDKDIRTEMIRDIEKHAKAQLGEVEGILVCGDIAFSGKKEEYTIAKAFLDDICNILEIQNERVYCVPGNHDVDQSIPLSSHAIMELQNSLSQSETQEIFDCSLARYCRNDVDGELLFNPIKMYNKNFAGIYKCDISREQPYWNATLSLFEKYALILRGMNSTTISNHNDHASDLDEERQMFLPSAQIPSRLESGDAIFLTLCHHPPECWYDPENKLKNKINARVHIQLYGHKHIQTIKKENNSLIINSGATHPERTQSEWIPRYNWLSIDILHGSNFDYLSVKIFPRILDPTADHFMVDDAICKGAQFIEYKLDILNEQSQDFCQKEKGLLEKNVSEQMLTIKELGGISYKTFIYNFMTLPIVIRSDLLVQFSLIKDEDDGKEHFDIAEELIDRAIRSNCIVQLWNEIRKRRM